MITGETEKDNAEIGGLKFVGDKGWNGDTQRIEAEFFPQRNVGTVALRRLLPVSCMICRGAFGIPALLFIVQQLLGARLAQKAGRS